MRSRIRDLLAVARRLGAGEPRSRREDGARARPIREQAPTDRVLKTRFGRVALLSIGVIISGAMLVACAANRPLACHDGERLLTLDTLYFGTASAAAPVSSAQWQDFVEQVVSMAFPAGYTILQGEGAWRGGDGRLQHERSHVLQIVHKDDADAERSIERVISRYKREFRQESVLRVRAATCASF